MYQTQDFFNVEHYHKVRAARKRAGFSMLKTSRGTQHPLVGRRLEKKATGEIYKVQSAHLHWYAGWYIVFSIERNNSHAIISWENVSSIYEKIDEWCEQSHSRYTVID